MDVYAYVKSQHQISTQFEIVADSALENILICPFVLKHAHMNGRNHKDASVDVSYLRTFRNLQIQTKFVFIKYILLEH